MLPDSNKLSYEAFNILPSGKKIIVTGGDERGMLYGCLSVAESLRNGTSLQKTKALAESPKLPFRAIKFNLPWDPYRTGEAVDLHIETCKDVNFGRSFLDMMAENRFNTLTLWNLHQFPYMIKLMDKAGYSAYSSIKLSLHENIKPRQAILKV